MIARNARKKLTKARRKRLRSYLRRCSMYKNSEGYPDQVQGEALNGVRREEKQRALERKYGYSRGQKIVVEAKVREDQGSRRMIAKKKITYTVKQLFPYCILLEDKHGIRICPSYTRLEAMIRGSEED